MHADGPAKIEEKGPVGHHTPLGVLQPHALHDLQDVYVLLTRHTGTKYLRPLSTNSTSMTSTSKQHDCEHIGHVTRDESTAS